MKKSKRYQTKTQNTQTAVPGEFPTWQFVANVTESMMPSIRQGLSYVDDLRKQERAADSVEMERLGLLFRTNRRLQVVLKTLGCLSSLAKYSGMETLDRPDKILVNRLCQMLALCGEVKACLTTDLPDYYTFATNEQALWKLLETLILQSVARLFRKRDQSGENRLVLGVSLAGRSGSATVQLVFTIEDNGDRMLTDEIELAFTLPDETLAGNPLLQERLELRLCWQIVRLLGGSIRIDPGYSQGRRVIVRLPSQTILELHGAEASDSTIYQI